jgi:nucleoside-diphosphate-sugar epimerase
MSQEPASTGAGNRVLVTGGTGFIGRHTLPLLVDAGYDVHVVTRGRDPDVAGVTVHHADLLVPGAAERLAIEVAPSHLLHAAWFLTPGQVWNSFENLRWVEASVAIVRAFAAAGGRRAVMAGTCSEYLPGDGPCVEGETPLDPTTLYGASKDAVRSLSELAAREAGFELAWARIFLAFGPYEHPARLVSSITRNLLLGRPAPCSHGRQVRDYLYTPDIGAALVALLASGVTGPVNVGSGEPVTLRQIIEHIGQGVGRPDLIEFDALTPPEHEPKTLVADVTRLREEVGFRPAHTLEQGLDATIDWWREHSTVTPGT